MPEQEPDNNNSFFVLVIVVFCIMLVALALQSCKHPDSPIPTNIHKCDWVDCDHQGEEMDQWKFVSQWGHEEYTDSWCVEITHFMNPEMSYEETEEYVFSGVE